MDSANYKSEFRYRLIYRLEDCPEYRLKCDHANFQQLMFEISSLVLDGFTNFLVLLQHLEGEYVSYNIDSNFDVPTSYDQYLGNV